MLVDTSIVSRAVINGLYLDCFKESQSLVHQVSCISQSFSWSPWPLPQGSLLLLILKQDLVHFKKQLYGVAKLIDSLAVLTILSKGQCILLGKHGGLTVRSRCPSCINIAIRMDWNLRYFSLTWARERWHVILNYLDDSLVQSDHFIHKTAKSSRLVLECLLVNVLMVLSAYKACCVREQDPAEGNVHRKPNCKNG